MDCSRSPYFFKIFFPQLSSQQLGIPPAFNEHIKGDAPVTACLRGPSGRTWYVDLVNNSSGLCFDNGWDEFVADHSIELGDLLVFRYDGNLRFTVLLFDTTACEKKCAFFARPCVEEITVLEKSEGGGGASFEELPVKDLSRPQNVGVQSRTRKRTRQWEDSLLLQGSPRKKHYSPSDKTTGGKSQIHATVEKSKSSLQFSYASNSPHSPRSQPRKNSPSKQITAKRPYVCSVKKSNTAKRPYVRTGLATTKKSNSTKKSRVYSGLATIKKSKSSSCHRHAHESQRSVVLATPRRSITTTKRKGYIRSPSSPNKAYRIVSRVERGKMEREMGDVLAVRRTYSTKSKSQIMGKEVRSGSLLSQRRPVTKEEANKALARAKSFKSANPFFIIVMREAYVYTSFALHIPRWFAEANLLKYGEKLTVILWDSDRKPWPVIFHKYRSTGRFGGGWSKFSYCHNLEQYDVCVFELLKKKHMRVHIFRVVKELTPLISFAKRR